MNVMEKKKGKNNMVVLSKVQTGECFNSGIGEFIVLEHAEGETKVIMKNLFETFEQFGQSADYKESYIRNLCDEKIYEAFAKEFGAENIIEHEVDLITVDVQRDYGKINCKVRPLTFDEARQYNDMLSKPDLEDWYWTCTACSSEERECAYSIAQVSPSGCICTVDYDRYGGIRPICILKSNIHVSKEE